MGETEGHHRGTRAPICWESRTELTYVYVGGGGVTTLSCSPPPHHPRSTGGGNLPPAADESQPTHVPTCPGRPYPCRGTAVCLLLL